MRVFYKGKDGGYESTVWGYWLVEIKGLFSIVLLCFESGSRDAYHEHAFHAISWVLKGKLYEVLRGGGDRYYSSSLRPVFTPRSRFHKVVSIGRTWVLSFRGPWTDTWREYRPAHGEVVLTHGRQEI